MAALKLGRDLRAGERVLVTLNRKSGRTKPATVLAVKHTVQTVQRPVIRVTLRDEHGHVLDREYPPNHTFHMLND